MRGFMQHLIKHTKGLICQEYLRRIHILAPFIKQDISSYAMKNTQKTYEMCVIE